MAQIKSNPTALNVVPKRNLPSWAANATLNVWMQIPNTALSSIPADPRIPGNPAGKVTAWCSMAIDPTTSRLYQAAGGGHGDYAGNEVEVIDLSVDNPRWVRLKPPSFPVQDGPYYGDNTPTSRHNMFGTHFNVHDNRIMLFGGDRYSTGAILSTVDSFNLSTNSYSPPGTHPDIPNALNNAEMKPMCVDPRNSDVYVFGGSGSSLPDPVVYRWNRSTNSWSSGVSVSSIARCSDACWNTEQNVIALVNGMSVKIYDPRTQEMSAVTLGGVTVPLPNDADFRGNSTVYVPELDSYLHYVSSSGGTVYKIHASNFTASNLNTTGGGSIPSNQHGSFGRFRYAPNLHGIVYAPVYDGNVWFLRVI